MGVGFIWVLGAKGGGVDMGVELACGTEAPPSPPRALYIPSALYISPTGHHLHVYYIPAYLLPTFEQAGGVVIGLGVGGHLCNP